MTADAISARRAAEALRCLTGREVVLLPAKDDVLLYKEAVSRETLFARLSAAERIYSGVCIVVCDAESAMQLFPARGRSIELAVGTEHDYVNLSSELVAMGYTREYEVEAKGSFAVRGDILDIFPINCENPVRIDFFGDTVERIRPYDAVSGERLKEIASVEILCAAEAIIPDGDLQTVKSELAAGLKKFSDIKAFGRARAIADDIITKAEGGAPFAGA